MNTAPVVAVLGYPIHHSKSPKMHGYWLKQAGVSGYYVPLEIHQDNLEAALKNMPKLGFRGANVTIPHKETRIRDRGLRFRARATNRRGKHVVFRCGW